MFYAFFVSPSYYVDYFIGQGNGFWFSNLPRQTLSALNMPSCASPATSNHCKSTPPRRSLRLQRPVIIAPIIPQNIGKFSDTISLAPSSTVYNTAECMFVIMEDCSWSSLVTLSHVNRAGRNRIRHMVSKRVNHTLRHFVDTSEHRDALFAQLDILRGGITGSVTWAIMNPQTILSQNDQPRDLNILTPQNTLGQWQTFLPTIGYSQESSTDLRYPFLETSSITRRFHHDTLVDNHKVRLSHAVAVMPLRISNRE